MGSSSRRSRSKSKKRECERHPKHRQSNGVCSLCLSEKLSKVSSCRYTVARPYYCSSSSLSSLSSTQDSSFCPSSCSSPRHYSVSFTETFKSTSMAASYTSEEGNNFRSEEKNKMKKKKFISEIWSKLLRPRRNFKRTIHYCADVDCKVSIFSHSQPLASSNCRSVAVH